MNDSTKIFLSLLEKEKGFLKLVTEELPQYSAEWYAYHSSTKCSCKNKIIAYLESDCEISERIIQKYKSENKFDEKEELIKIKQEEENNRPRYMAGKIFKILESDYENFIDRTKKEKWLYKGMSIETTGCNLKIFIY